MTVFREFASRGLSPAASSGSGDANTAIAPNLLSGRGIYHHPDTLLYSSIVCSGSIYRSLPGHLYNFLAIFQAQLHVPGSLSGDFLRPLVTFLLIVSFLLTLAVSRPPAHVEALDTTTPTDFTAILEQARQAMATAQWENAKSCFEQALQQAEPSRRESIEQQLALCRANIALAKQYSDASVALHIRSIDRENSHKILSETLGLIKKNYYRNINLRLLFKKALFQMEVAVESPFVCQQFSIEPAQLEPLRTAIHDISSKLERDKFQGDNSIYAARDKLCNIIENSKLSEAWPDMQLAYALTDNLDSYSHLLSPLQYKVLCDQLGGYYVGTGLDLIMDEQGPLVFDVVERSPADKAKVMAGDRLLEIAGKNCRGMSSYEISHLLSGKNHTRVTIVIQRGTTTYPVTLKREIVEAPSVRHVKMLDSTTGFFRVAGFNQNTVMEMKRAVEKLQSKGAHSLIIDLRSNGGGIMTSAIDAARLFLDTGTIVTVYSEQETIKYKAGGHYFSAFRLPLVILVDKQTASAAEIFTAALQDNLRATVCGEQTFGKAVVQTIYDLQSGPNALCITTAAYLPPSRKDINKRGIVPDFTIAASPSPSQSKATMKEYLSADNTCIQTALHHLNSVHLARN